MLILASVIFGILFVGWAVLRDKTWSIPESSAKLPGRCCLSPYGLADGPFRFF